MLIYGRQILTNVGRPGCTPRLTGGLLRTVTARSKYERMRAVHLNAVQAALVDHTARLDWAPEQIERYREHQLRALLSYARQRSPFHARRLRALDLSPASVAGTAPAPITKQP